MEAFPSRLEPTAQNTNTESYLRLHAHFRCLSDERKDYRCPPRKSQYRRNWIATNYLSTACYPMLSASVVASSRNAAGSASAVGAVHWSSALKTSLGAVERFCDSRKENAPWIGLLFASDAV